MSYNINCSQHEVDASPGTVVVTFVVIVIRTGTLAVKTAILILLIIALFASWIARLLIKLASLVIDIPRLIFMSISLLKENRRLGMDAKVQVREECIGDNTEDKVMICMEEENVIEKTLKLDRISQKLWNTKNQILKLLLDGLSELDAIHLEIYYCLEEVGQLPEKSEYVFERYVHDFRHYVSNVVNPKWKKTQFTYGGIMLGPNEGFSHYLHKRKTLCGVYRCEPPYKLNFSKVNRNPYENKLEISNERPSKRSHIRRELLNFKPIKEPSVYSINDNISIFESNSTPLKSLLHRNYMKESRINGINSSKEKNIYSENIKTEEKHNHKSSL